MLLDLQALQIVWESDKVVMVVVVKGGGGERRGGGGSWWEGVNRSDTSVSW